jgi:hypothetical protein
VAVVEKVDGEGEAFLDAIIIDTKLSQFTDFTTNQNTANGMGSLTIKSIPINSKIKGNDIANFRNGENISKNGSIKKMWSDGNGNYQDVK